MADRVEARRPLSRHWRVPRARQQVPENHQRWQYQDSRDRQRGQRRHRHRRLHGDDVRDDRRGQADSAGRCCRACGEGSEVAMGIRLTVAFIALLAAPVAAQSVAPAPATAATTAAPVPAVPPAKTEEPAGYTYQGGGRRDPFISLLRRGNEEKRSTSAARAAGLAGLGVSEVTLKGTLHGQESYLGILLGADAKTYIVRPGDRLVDGTIRAITPDSVVILQQVNDPLSPQKQREVRKMLRQTEEAK